MLDKWNLSETNCLDLFLPGGQAVNGIGRTGSAYSPFPVCLWMWQTVECLWLCIRSSLLEDLLCRDIKTRPEGSRYFASKPLIPVMFHACRAGSWSSPDNLAEQCYKILLSLWSWSWPWELPPAWGWEGMLINKETDLNCSDIWKHRC